MFRMPVRVDGHSFTVPLPDGNRFFVRSAWENDEDGWYADRGRTNVLFSTFKRRGQNCSVVAYLQRSRPGEKWDDLDGALGDYADVDDEVGERLTNPSSDATYGSYEDDSQTAADVQPSVPSTKTRFDVQISCGRATAYRRYASASADFEAEFGQEVAKAQAKSRRVVVKTAIAGTLGFTLFVLLALGARWLALSFRKQARRQETLL